MGDAPLLAPLHDLDPICWISPRIWSCSAQILGREAMGEQGEEGVTWEAEEAGLCKKNVGGRGVLSKGLRWVGLAWAGPIEHPLPDFSLPFFHSVTFSPHLKNSSLNSKNPMINYSGQQKRTCRYIYLHSQKSFGYFLHICPLSSQVACHLDWLVHWKSYVWCW
jgi:hypothetical protein